MLHLSVKISILLLFFAAIFDPIGFFHGLRYIALGFSLIITIITFSTGKIKFSFNDLRWNYITLLTIVMPIYGVFLLLLNHNFENFTDTANIASGILILFSLLLFDSKLAYFGVKAMIINLRILSIAIILTYVFITLGVDDQFRLLLIEYNIAIIGDREYLGITLPYIYFVASPMLIYLVSHDIFIRLNTKKSSTISTIFLLSSIIALALTGTRAHQLLALFFIPIYQLFFLNKNSLIKSILALALILALVLMLPNIADLLISFFSTTETNNSIKILLLDGYIDLFSHPLTLLFGQGLNAHVWSNEFKTMIAMDINATKTEATYLEIIRVYGLLLGGVFISLLFYTVQKTKKIHPSFIWIYPALTIYLINASLNAYLFSTNGILPLCIILALIRYFPSQAIPPK